MPLCPAFVSVVPVTMVKPGLGPVGRTNRAQPDRHLTVAFPEHHQSHFPLTDHVAVFVVDPVTRSPRLLDSGRSLLGLKSCIFSLDTSLQKGALLRYNSQFTTKPALLSFCICSFLLLLCDSDPSALSRPSLPGKEGIQTTTNLLEHNDGQIDAPPYGNRTRIAAVAVPQGELADIDFDRNALSNAVGGGRWKLVFCHQSKMYLISSESDYTWRISQGNEGWDGAAGRPHSPRFSPDGRYIAFTGELFNSQKSNRSFVQEAIVGPDSVCRMEIAPGQEIVCDPQWYIDPTTGERFLYYVDTYGSVKYDSSRHTFDGLTWKVAFLNDSTLSEPMATDLPGAFRGGFSRDGIWVGTAYSTAGLYRRDTQKLFVLGCGNQYCNPSINPFAVGSANSDYLLLLGFGNLFERGSDRCRSLVTVTEDTLYEGLHHNLWMFNSSGRVVWRGERIDGYLRFNRPEWSTHPLFVTSIMQRRASQMATNTGDLYLIKLPELANANRTEFHKASVTDFIKIGVGGFSAADWSHLWVDWNSTALSVR